MESHVQLINFACAPFTGAIIEPRSQHESVLTQNGPPQTCTSCGAFIIGIGSSSDEASCPFCEGSSSILSRPHYSAIEYLDIGGSDEILDRLPTPDQILRVVAFDLSSKDMESLKTATSGAIQSLAQKSPSTCLAFLAFGRAPTIFRLGKDSSGGGSTNSDALPLDVFLDKHRYSCAVGTCCGSVQRAIQTLTHQSTSWDWLEALQAIIDAVISIIKRQSYVLSETTEPPYDNGRMDRSTYRVSAQVTIVSAGASRQWGSGMDDDQLLTAVENLTEFAASNGVVVDIVATPSKKVMEDNSSLRLLNTLALGTGGYLIPNAIIGPAFAANLEATLRRDCEGWCTLEVRCTPAIRVLRAIGQISTLVKAGVPTREWHDAQQRRPLPRGLKFPNVWMYQCHSIDTFPKAVSLLLDVHKGGGSKLKDAHWIQAAFAWTRTDGAPMHLVISKSISSQELLNSTGDHVGTSAVLFCKAILSDALQQGATRERLPAELLKRRIISEMRDIAETYGTPDKNTGGWFNGPRHYHFPTSLLPIAHAGYLIRYQVLNNDSPLRSDVFFVQLETAPLAIAQRICCPELRVILPATLKGKSREWQPSISGPAVELVPLPAVDLALTLSSAAVLDCGIVVYVWLQATAIQNSRVVEACMAHARRTACNRWPQADIIVVRQGDASQRQMFHWLRPIASDDREVQLFELPLLAGISPEERAAATQLAHLNRSSAPSLSDWLQSIDVVLPSQKL